MDFKLGNNYHGFILKEEEYIKEVNSKARIFEHEKTKAKLLHMENEDSNKVFSIGFKTPPTDSTGVMHILEHSVLCGSRKFPTKEPFVELVKGSLNTFLNAMTYSDKTIYPIASQNDKDFFNLMDVYLDAVFYPNIYKTKEILMQEGWHYDLENKEEELTYKGVVYNEMKGAFSSPEGILMRKIQETLFPDNTYSNESGGDPKYIPDLTYEQFIDTHKRYYHPSNSYIFLYGNGDLDKMLAFINENYLQNFDYKEIDTTIKPQEKYKSMKEISYPYSISEEDEEADKTFLTLNFVTGRSTDEEVYMDLNILEYLLLETEGAPLKKAILDSGIAKDVFGSFDNGILQPTFSIIAKNSEVNKKDEFKKIVFDTLKKLVDEGIDKKLIEGCINVFEFRLRESDTGDYPKGLVYYMNAMDSWLYGGDPLMYIKYEKAIENVKKALTTNHFENLIEKYILNNTHSSMLILSPQKGLSENEDSELKKKLEKYKSSLSDEEIAKIVDDTKSLILRQSTPDSQEVLETIPMLSLDDIGKEVDDLIVEELKYDNIELLYHKEFTSNIAYLNFMFYAKCIDEKDISYFSLLGSLLGKVSTKTYDYKDLSNEILINTGNLYFKNQVYAKDKDNSKFYPFLELHTKVMDDKIENAMNIISDIIKNSIFEDEKRIRELIRELISRIEMNIMQSGHQVAVDRLSSYFSPSSAYAEKIFGYDYYEFLKNIENNFETEIKVVKAKLYELQKLIFNKNNLTIAVTGEDKELELLKANIKKVTDVLLTDTVENKEYKFIENQKNEGLMTSANVQYVAKGYNFTKLNYEYSGSMLVLKTILGYDYLWNRVRVQGGAYGAMVNITRAGNMVFVSYRDPNLAKTLDAYNEASSFVKDFNVSDREMTKYIIGTVSNLDYPLSPSAKGEKAVTMYIRGITKSDRQKEREQVLSTKVENIESYSKVVQDVMDKDFIAVVGNEKMLKENKNILKQLVNVFN
ncbi:insulinase family protein [Romboutsia weinsteinii]|uniref:Insulinase family protein n=1 Tax=Romboutsia weinsteinii TaxID=2020949 RepID=A0A371IZ36_9FIRM|nr:insulinase family protein [Romboutsia weinsteinii]RDY25743.1 insulinase family protein [Romboutsia weinsteinii]